MGAASPVGQTKRAPAPAAGAQPAAKAKAASPVQTQVLAIEQPLAKTLEDLAAQGAVGEQEKSAEEKADPEGAAALDNDAKL